jgi:cation transport regulator ChaB
MPTRGPNDGLEAESPITPRPDPTFLTTQQLIRESAGLREMITSKLDAMEASTILRLKVIETRLDGMDRAIDLVKQLTDKLPSQIDEKLSAKSYILEEKLASVQTQFKERDTRSERESRDNKVAVDAAFAAQKEAAAKQDEANAKAIDKSEKATAETIKTNQELSRAGMDAITKSLDEVKQRLTRFEGKEEGGVRKVVEHQASGNYIIAIIGCVVGVISILVAIAVVFSKH